MALREMPSCRRGIGCVLIVEDDEVERYELRVMLERNGWEVSEAASVGEARLRLMRDPVDVVVSALQLPGESGLDLLRQARHEYPAVPVILKSGSSEAAHAVTALHERAFEYLLEPVGSTAILASVRAAFAEREARLELQAAGRVLSTSPPGASGHGETGSAPGGEGILILDLDGDVLHLNRTAEELLDVHREAVVGRPVATLSGLAELHRALESARHGDGSPWLFDLRRPGGVTRTLEVDLAGGAGQGAPGGSSIVLTLRDASRRHEAMQEVVRSTRLACLGAMSGALAHEINNPMTVMLAGLETVMSDLGARAPELTERLRLVERSALQCAGVVRTFLKLARDGEEAPGPVALEGILADIMFLLGKQFAARRIAVALDADPDVPPARGRPTQVQQLLMALLLEAREGLPDGGVVEMRLTSSRDSVLLQLDYQRARPPVAASVVDASDHAGGWAAGSVAFEACQVLAGENGGTFRTSPSPGRGVTYLLDLPLHRTAVGGGADVWPGASRRDLDLDVLVVDDEPSILELCGQILQRSGCRSQLYRDPLRALADFSAGHFDLAILDIQLPHLDGFELARRLQKLDADVSFLFISGSLSAMPGRDVFSGKAVGLLSKPFTSSQVVGRLEDVAGGSRARLRPVRRAEAEPIGTPEPPRVVVVDDDEGICELTEICLRASGRFRVTSTTSALEALELIRASPPDLVLTDLRMPEIDGFELCRRVKEDPATSRIPVVILSVLREIEDVQRALRYGAADYLMKPFDPNRLPDQLEHVLQRTRPRMSAKLMRSG